MARNCGGKQSINPLLLATAYWLNNKYFPVNIIQNSNSLMSTELHIVLSLMEWVWFNYFFFLLWLHFVLDAAHKIQMPQIHNHLQLTQLKYLYSLVLKKRNPFLTCDKAGTLFYLATHITTSLRPFYVTAAIAATPYSHKWCSTFFSSV
jgi:hypothetical protein